MANNFLTDYIIANAAIVCLKNNLSVAPLVSLEYQKVFKKKGDVIGIRRPQRAKIRDGINLQKSTKVDLETQLKIDTHKQHSFEIGAADRTLSVDEFQQRYMQTPMAGMANAVDYAILLNSKYCYNSAPHAPGSTPGVYADWSNAGAKCTDLAWPDDRQVRAVINPTTKAVLGQDVKDLFNEQMVRNAYLNGYSGDVDKFSMHVSQNTRRHTVGAWNGVTLVTATAIVTNADGTTSVEIDGCGSNVAQFARIGDVLTFATVYSVNPQNYSSTGYLQDFVVAADATSAGGVVTVKVMPQMNDGTLTMLNANGQTVSLEEYQNITNVPPENAAATIRGVAETTYREDFLFHRDAIVMASVDLYVPEILNPQTVSDSGISMTLSKGGDINDLSETTRLDMLFGTKLAIPELAMRMWGDDI